MARLYGKIETSTWTKPKFRSLSAEARLLWLYLVACPHGNALGLFTLPIAYAAHDLQWEPETVSKRLLELVTKRFIERDETVELTRIIGWWGHNAIENMNVAIAALKCLDRIPASPLVSRAFADVSVLPVHLATEFRKRYPNGIETVSKQSRNPEPEPEPEPETSKSAEQVSAPTYHFAGKIVCLTEKDYREWESVYRHIPNLWAELMSRDDWLVGQPEAAQNKWWISTRAYLKNRDAAFGLEAKKRAEEPDVYDDMEKGIIH